MARLKDYGLKSCGFRKCSPCYLNNYESSEMKVVAKYLQWKYSNDLILNVSLDIGAHVGLWSAFLAGEYRQYGGGTVYALEPETRNFRALEHNAKLLTDDIIEVTPIMAAAWGKTCTLSIQQNVNFSRHYVTDKFMAGRDVPTCQAVAIDDVPTKDNASQFIDFIKIDVEGAELHVLNGMRQTLDDNKNVLVLVEYSLGHFARYGHNAKQVNGFMNAIGLKFARPQDEEAATKISGGAIKKIFFVKGRSPWQN